MAYQPHYSQWRNAGDDGDPTPITAQALTNMDQGITGAHERIDQIPEPNDGQDGQDGVTPHIGDNGNWYIGDTDTGTPARGPAGRDGTDGTDGADGADGFPSEDDWNDLVARVEALENTGDDA